MVNLVKIDGLPIRLEIVDGRSLNDPTDQNAQDSSFEIVVTNCSQRFASFQVELSLDGVDRVKTGYNRLPNRWYRVEPEVCAKKPPGAKTTFKIFLDKAPLPGFGQILPLNVHVFSMEYDDLQATQSVELKLRRPRNPVKVEFPFEDLRVYPGGRLLIPIVLLNLTPDPVDVNLTLSGKPSGEAKPSNSGATADDKLQSRGRATAADGQVATPKSTKQLAYVQPEWFEDKEKKVIVPSGASKLVEFCCCPPTTKEQLPDCQLYRFRLKATVTDRDSYNKKSRLESDAQVVFENNTQVIEILPYGEVTVNYLQSDTKDIKGDWKTRSVDAAFTFAIANRSNIAQRVDLYIEPEAESTSGTLSIETGAKTKNALSTPPNSAELRQTSPAARSTLEKLLPGQSEQVSLSIPHRRNWVGWPRRYIYSAVAQLSVAENGGPSHSIQPVPQRHPLAVTVKPVLPVWLQMAGGLVALLGLAAIGWLTPGQHHRAPVNSVRLIGNGTTVVSGSSDQTLRRWDVAVSPWQRLRSQLWYREKIAKTDRAIWVIEASPFRDSQLAVGLESGDIELWEVSPPQRIHHIFEGSDRVFDLAFTADAQHLFSGHGSGLVRQWDVQTSKVTQHQLNNGKAIAALATLELNGRSVVAIGGQYNTLLLWDWEADQTYSIDYSPAEGPAPLVESSANYITSLAATNDSRLLLVADNRGYISLWPQELLIQCLNQLPVGSPSSPPSPVSCQRPQGWSAQRPISLDSQGIRALALSNDVANDGCYHLAIASNSGHLHLHSLNSSNTPAELSAQGIVLAHYPGTPIRALDIQQIQAQELLIAANGPGNDVRLHRYRSGCGEGKLGGQGAREQGN